MMSRKKIILAGLGAGLKALRLYEEDLSFSLYPDLSAWPMPTGIVEPEGLCPVEV